MFPVPPFDEYAAREIVEAQIREGDTDLGGDGAWMRERHGDDLLDFVFQLFGAAQSGSEENVLAMVRGEMDKLARQRVAHLRQGYEDMRNPLG